ncbi:maleylpyruvate isomerase family mycothiol-dependent enzyme [Kitasatospora sp. NPDC101155]|uniref:maleylpyruvate isomerase family mycothiol-dependent enzyme n=1 Tax=Kitasatospora sp. NPDC101155 TaxID=3364097 RepID=UPI0038247FA6
MITTRDPARPGRLLRTERETLLPLLRDTPLERFELPTACPDWTVRELLAHCGAALMRIVEGRLPGFTPEHNAADVAERADWPVRRILDELESGMAEAGPAIEAADGELDVIALGEWVHAGDVREALGVTAVRLLAPMAFAAAAVLAVEGSATTTARPADNGIVWPDPTPAAPAPAHVVQAGIVWPTPAPAAG